MCISSKRTNALSFYFHEIQQKKTERAFIMFIGFSWNPFATAFKFNFRFKRWEYRFGCLSQNDPSHIQCCTSINRDRYKHHSRMAPGNVDCIYVKATQKMIYYTCDTNLFFSVFFSLAIQWDSLKLAWMDRLDQFYSPDCIHKHLICYSDLLRDNIVFFLFILNSMSHTNHLVMWRKSV